MPKKNITKRITNFHALSFLTLSSLSSFATSEDKNTTGVQLRTAYPQDYIVVKGDTLWAIAAKFLHNPWIWPKVWDANPQIKDPHLIYPGDIISVLQKNGKTVLHVERPSPEKGLRVIKLSPKVRTAKRDEAIKTIEASAIRSFIINPQILTAEEYERLPYIIGNFEGRLISCLLYTSPSPRD